MTNSFDLNIFIWLHSFSGKFFIVDSLAILFSEYVFYAMLVAVALLPFVILYERYEGVQWQPTFRFFFLTGFSTLLATSVLLLIRGSYDRFRPFEILPSLTYILQHAGGVSFPSAHATISFALATAVYLQFPRIGKYLFVIAFLISLARVFGGVHWPSDVIAGAFIGIVSGYFVSYLSKKFLKRPAIE